MKQRNIKPASNFSSIGTSIPLFLVAFSSFLLSVSSALAGPDLAGTWRTPVFFSKHYHIEMEHEFKADGSTKFKLKLYSALPYQALGQISERTGTWQVIGPSVLGGSLYEIDIKISDVFFTMLDPDSIEELNKDGDSCSTQSPWVIAVPKKVTGSVCMNDYIAKNGDIEKLVFRIEEDRLFWGPYWGPKAVMARDSATANVRTNELDESIYFQRVEN